MWGERAWGGGSASGVHGEGPTQGCAESKGGHAMRGEVRVQQRAAWERHEGVGWRRRKWRAREGPDSRLGARTRAERTSNMSAMFVTLEVSQLEMSALKFFNS